MKHDLRQLLRQLPPKFPMPESPLLDVPETAKYSHQSIRFVRRELRYRIPTVKIANRLFFYKADIDRFFAENTQIPAK